MGNAIDKWIDRFNWVLPAFLYMRLQRLHVHPNGRAPAESSVAGLTGADDWAPSHYAAYFATSTPVYSAVRLRADAIARPPLRVYRRVETAGEWHREWVGPEHPAQRLLDRVNPHWTGGDFWRATETYLNLWGVAYWSVERDDLGMPVELWPLRPDRVRLVPDEKRVHPRLHVYRALRRAGRVCDGRNSPSAVLQSARRVRGAVPDLSGAADARHGPRRAAEQQVGTRQRRVSPAW